MAGFLHAQETFVQFNRDISFGEFYASEGSSGNICISNSGEVLPTQNINLLNADAHPASVVVSTTSEIPIDIQIEARAQRLQSQEGRALVLTLNAPNKNFYTIVRGKPAIISLGGCLELPAGVASSAGHYNGSISVDVIILNE